MYDSESYIDIRHLEYWDECIDDSYKDNDIPAEVVMIPQKDQRCYEVNTVIKIPLFCKEMAEIFYLFP